MLRDAITPRITDNPNPDLAQNSILHRRCLTLLTDAQDNAPPKEHNMSDTSNREKRVSILAAISDWLKLLGLIVLAAEALLLAAYLSTDRTDPVRKYYFPLMLVFLALIIPCLFVPSGQRVAFNEKYLSGNDKRFIGGDAAVSPHASPLPVGEGD